MGKAEAEGSGFCLHLKEHCLPLQRYCIGLLHRADVEVPGWQDGARGVQKIFRLAFPERPEDKLELLTTKVANVEKTDGKIPLHTIGMLLYLFCDGKTEDNLGQMFNLFDEDGNGSINVEELLNMMAFFIEIGADAGSVDLATVMAEMFQSGDRNNDEKLTKAEFEKGMMNHPVISSLLKVKTIDALLSTF